jgi:hypothetical protein
MNVKSATRVGKVLNLFEHLFVLAAGAFLRESLILISASLVSIKNPPIQGIAPAGDTWGN